MAADASRGAEVRVLPPNSVTRSTRTLALHTDHTIDATPQVPHNASTDAMRFGAHNARFSCGRRPAQRRHSRVRFGLADRSICWKVCFAPAHSEVREMLAEADGPHHVLLSWVWPACDGGADIVAFELQARFHCAHCKPCVRLLELLSERLGVWSAECTARRCRRGVERHAV